MKSTASRFVIAAWILFVASAYAKGPTRKILIRGGDLREPVEIMDAAVLRNFAIWGGPGTSTIAEHEPALNRAPETFIVANWAPLPAPPSQLMRYQVSFYADHHKDGLDYVVTYVHDPAKHRGFVYLPGKGEPEYSLNVFSIYRGLEGNWFEARKSWVDVMTAALVAKE